MYFILEECLRWFTFLLYFFTARVFNLLAVVFGLNLIPSNLSALEFCLMIALTDRFKIRILERNFQCFSVVDYIVKLNSQDSSLVGIPCIISDRI